MKTFLRSRLFFNREFTDWINFLKRRLESSNYPCVWCWIFIKNPVILHRYFFKIHCSGKVVKSQLHIQSWMPYYPSQIFCTYFMIILTVVIIFLIFFFDGIHRAALWYSPFWIACQLDWITLYCLWSSVHLINKL